LLSGNAEWWARNASCQKIDALKVTTPEVTHILLENIPSWPICSQSRTALRITLDKR
jgi:hypothetical protein